MTARESSRQPGKTGTAKRGRKVKKTGKARPAKKGSSTKKAKTTKKGRTTEKAIGNQKVGKKARTTSTGKGGSTKGAVSSSTKKALPESGEFVIHVFSDATGSLARHVMLSLLSQFPGLEYRIVLHVFQGDPRSIRASVRELERDRSLVIYALVDSGARGVVETECQRRKIPSHDLTGPTAAFIEKVTGVPEVADVDRIHRIDEGYLEKIQALEYTLQHDDSRRLETVGEADIVIIGLSRVSKTPTATYLGSLGYRVANVSLVPDHGLPEPLKAARGKIIAFTLSAERLNEIRSRRFDAFRRKIRAAGLEDLPYYSSKATAREVMAAEEIYRANRFPVLDTTGLTVEETAARVLKILPVQKSGVIYA